VSKIILEFNTDDEDGIYEEEKAKRAVHATDAFSLIYEINNEIKKHLKYGNDADNIKVIERLQDMIYVSGLLDMYN